MKRLFQYMIQTNLHQPHDFYLNEVYNNEMKKKLKNDDKIHDYTSKLNLKLKSHFMAFFFALTKQEK